MYVYQNGQTTIKWKHHNSDFLGKGNFGSVYKAEGVNKSGQIKYYAVKKM